MNAMADKHISVLLDEAVSALVQRPHGIYVDCTFGRGGHSRAILARLDANARLIALDRDPAAIEAAAAINDSRFRIFHAPFSRLQETLATAGLSAVDGILLDLGVSSPQLDEAARGMSFRFDAPLDMRMDTTCGQSAAQWLATASVPAMTEVFKNYGEERFAYAIATSIATARTRGGVATTGQLARIVEKAVHTHEPSRHPATRTFQAIRIFINQELEELALVLPQSLELLKDKGRLVVLSFHSLEDRIVKRFLRDQSRPQDDFPRRFPIRSEDLPAAKMRLIGRARRPSAAEVVHNPRARSVVMRVGERIGSAA